MRERDSQRSKVYRAERILDERSKAHLVKTVPEVEAYLTTVLRDEWFRQQFPWVKRVVVKDGRARSHAEGCRSKGQPWMTLPRWAMHPSVILHELAHGIQPKDTAAHGVEFCSIFVRLVYRFMGPEAFRDLTDSFRGNRVQYVTRKLVDISPAIGHDQLMTIQKSSSSASNQQAKSGAGEVFV